MAKKKDTVIYKELKDFPGYRVGSDGSFWSKRVKIAAGKGKGSKSVIGDAWHRISVQLGTQKYLRVWLYGHGNININNLVLQTFVGERPKGKICCHNDGNPENNAVSNLRWDTPKSNAADRTKHGTNSRGIKHWKAKLTEDQIRTIRKDYFAGDVLKKDLAKKYGISKDYPRRLALQLSWAHLT